MNSSISTITLTERLRILAPGLIVIVLLILIPVFALMLTTRYNADLVRFAETQAERSVGLTVQEVLEAIASGPQGDVIWRFRQAKVYAEDGVIELLVDLWDRRTDRYPELDWGLLDRENIRVELADVLADASRKNRVEVTLEPLLKQFRQSAMFAQDELVQRKAITNIGLFDDPIDVPLLLQITLSENELIHLAGVGALAAMCNAEARDALATLLETAPVDRAAHLHEIAEGFEEAYDERSEWCRCRLWSCPEPHLQ